MQIENTRAYRKTFGESRKVHQKGRRMTKPMGGGLKPLKPSSSGPSALYEK